MKKLYISIIIGTSIFTYLCFNPLVVFVKEEINLFLIEKKYKKGDTIKVLDRLNFNEGHWVAYLVINMEDSKDIDNRIPIGKILKTENLTLLKEMKRNWMFKYTGGDLATVQSQIRFYKDDKFIFGSNIVLDRTFEALHNTSFGCVYPIEEGIVVKYCMQFERVFYPFVIL
ncbi:hypothetical protein [uncultured Tenacibaculum sp.]|uniref:hypothetical protein n=1 Tax=uncultured Tenacibaculum sp. TaxID=174713 RepID=UPI002619C43B|nr:hypothetical protein [uncultured Tenacibaculum sp.]